MATRALWVTLLTALLVYAVLQFAAFVWYGDRLTHLTKLTMTANVIFFAVLAWQRYFAPPDAPWGPAERALFWVVQGSNSFVTAATVVLLCFRREDVKLAQDTLHDYDFHLVGFMNVVQHFTLFPLVLLLRFLDRGACEDPSCGPPPFRDRVVWPTLYLVAYASTYDVAVVYGLRGDATAWPPLVSGGVALLAAQATIRWLVPAHTR